ncbi:MAG: hypothetical protein BV456_07540 [Thermoplasmata archaeon M8B2D]|nr:MAG: hypothetical protein BV456_07540 [Thermoplasmata archaeon M8B2D]
MKYLFELSKDHNKLPAAEVFSCLKAEKIDYEILESNEDVAIIDVTESNDILNVVNRLSHTFNVNQYLFSSSISIDEINKTALKNKIEKKGSIAIKYRNRSKNVDSQKIVKTLAEIYTKNMKVSLQNPDIEIRALISDSKLYVGLKLYEINRTQFEKRKVQFRPFFSPVSLHPRIARALVNLSNIEKNAILLDPFCGTGGILLEAGLIGAKVIGNDIEEKMIVGCRKTLDYYGINNYSLLCLDIGDIHNYLKAVDAVVTDFPYGKSTTTRGENLIDLYSRAFQSIARILKTGGRAVIGISRNDLIKIGKLYFSHVETHEFRTHRSLTRYFVVFKK